MFDPFPALCLYDFKSEEETELAFVKGEVLKIISSEGTGWWCAQRDIVVPTGDGETTTTTRKKGWVPVIYMQRISPGLAKMYLEMKAEVEADIDDNESEASTPKKESFLLQDPSVVKEETRRPKSPTPSIRSRRTTKSAKSKRQLPRYQINNIQAKDSIARRPKRPYLPEAGTLESLINRVTAFPIKSKEDEGARHILLMSFTAFTTASRLLNLLIEKYNATPPKDLSEREKDGWESAVHAPSQEAIRSLLTDWIERYNLVEDDPQVIPALCKFLDEIYNSVTTDSIKEDIGALLDSVISHSPSSSPSLTSLLSPPTSQQVKPKPKWIQKVPFYILPVSERDLAEQLTLHGAKLYYAIRPRECFAWGKVECEKREVKHLDAFRRHSERIEAWVVHSILREEGVRRRAFVVDRWIRIAEHCLDLADLNTTSTILSALAQPPIQRLSRTLTLSKQRGKMNRMNALFTSSNNYEKCRKHTRGLSKQGACIPFLAMDLERLQHIEEEYNDFVTLPSSTDQLINFVKAQRMVEVADSLLAHQHIELPYTLKIKEVPRTAQLVRGRLALSSSNKDWLEKLSLSRARKEGEQKQSGLRFVSEVVGGVPNFGGWKPAF